VLVLTSEYEVVTLVMAAVEAVDELAGVVDPLFRGLFGFIVTSTKQKYYDL
jgi:hypothetical protein